MAAALFSIIFSIMQVIHPVSPHPVFVSPDHESQSGVSGGEASG